MQEVSTEVIACSLEKCAETRFILQSGEPRIYSSLKNSTMNFLELHERLRLVTSNRLDQGISSRSLLARKTGLAQAHISNFLNRRRRLSLAAMDLILSAQALSVEDLCGPDRREFPPAKRDRLEPMDSIPIVAQSVAMNSPHISAGAVLDSLQLPSGWLQVMPLRRAAGRGTWERFVAVRVTSGQALPMQPVLRPGALAVIDRHYNSPVDARHLHPNLYAVRLGSQVLFRYVASEPSRLVLRPHSLDSPVEIIDLESNENPSSHIVGRICLCLCEP